MSFPAGVSPIEHGPRVRERTTEYRLEHGGRSLPHVKDLLVDRQCQGGVAIERDLTTQPVVHTPTEEAATLTPA